MNIKIISHEKRNFNCLIFLLILIKREREKKKKRATPIHKNIKEHNLLPNDVKQAN